MLPLYLVIAGLAAGASLVVWSYRRAPTPSVREGAQRTSIAELTAGRFRVVGRVVALRTSPSEVDGAPCVYLERARYAHVGGGFVPLLREVAHAHAAHTFYLDDGSARLLVDPATTLIECAVATGDSGLVAERRLRAGEEIELVATFRPSDGLGMDDLDQGPYRAPASRYEPGPDGVGPPRITYRTEAGMERGVPDETTSFLRGAGALLIATSSLFGALVLWLHGAL